MSKIKRYKLKLVDFYGRFFLVYSESFMEVLFIKIESNGFLFNLLNS